MDRRQLLQSAAATAASAVIPGFMGFTGSADEDHPTKGPVTTASTVIPWEGVPILAFVTGFRRDDGVVTQLNYETISRLYGKELKSPRDCFLAGMNVGFTITPVNRYGRAVVMWLDKPPQV